MFPTTRFKTFPCPHLPSKCSLGPEHCWFSHALEQPISYLGIPQNVLQEYVEEQKRKKQKFQANEKKHVKRSLPDRKNEFRPKMSDDQMLAKLNQNAQQGHRELTRHEVPIKEASDRPDKRPRIMGLKSTPKVAKEDMNKPPTMLPDIYSKIDRKSRQKALNVFFEEFKRIYSGILSEVPKLAHEHAVEQELAVYGKANPKSYMMMVISTVRRLKARPVATSTTDIGIDGIWSPVAPTRSSNETGTDSMNGPNSSENDSATPTQHEQSAS